MVLKLSLDSAGGAVAGPLPGQRNGQQVYSLELDNDSFGALLEALKKSGIDPAQLKSDPPAEGQNSAPVTPGGQNPATGAAAQAAAAPKADPWPAKPFAPLYRSATVTLTAGVPASWSLNPDYFASRETADWVAKKYGTGEVVELPYGGDGGPFQASEKEFHIKLANGKTVNAGILAAYYDRNPESQFPGVADKLIKDVLKSVTS
jgi:hypothetical protein